MENDIFCGVDPAAIAQRMDAKTDKSGDCWVWHGSKAKFGYGILVLNGKNRLAHRLSYALANNVSDLPRGKHVCHKCDNPPCINPAHLFLGSPWDNQEDKRRKGRIPYGMDAFGTKLSDDDVRYIRKHAVDFDGEVRCMQRYRVSQGTIQSIYKRKSRQNVPD